MSPPRRIGGVVLVALVATVALHLTGSGSLAAPPLGSWRGFDAWYVRSGAATAVVALVRLVAFVASSWLVVAGGLQLVAPVVAVDRFSAVVDGISPRFLRAISKRAAGLSVTAGLALPGLPSGSIENPPGIAVMVPLDVPATTTTTTTAPTTTAPTTTVAPTATTTARPTTTTTTVIVTEPAVPAVAAVEPKVAGAEVIVAPGDSFWSIAVEEAGELELVGYWHALIDANRDRLVDPSNPDLLYPDQVLRLP